MRKRAPSLTPKTNGTDNGTLLLLSRSSETVNQKIFPFLKKPMTNFISPHRTPFIFIMVINNINRSDHVDIIIMTNRPKSTKPWLPPPKAPSPTNVNCFPSDGWLTTTHPTKCIVPGQIGKILGFED
jgi:hypothetical protein